MPYKNPEDIKKYYQKNKDKIKKRVSDRYYKMHPNRLPNRWTDEKTSQLLFLRDIGISYVDISEIFNSVHSNQSIITKYSELCGSPMNPNYGKKEIRVCSYCGKEFVCSITSTYKMCSKKCSINNLIDNNPMKGKRGSKSPFWKGGKSFEIYPQEFNKDLKENIRRI